MKSSKNESVDDSQRFVRINKAEHPLHGMIGIAHGELTEDGFVSVRLLHSSVHAYLKPEDLQRIERGTKVLIEVEISDFFKDSMMIAGGWDDCWWLDAA